LLYIFFKESYSTNSSLVWFIFFLKSKIPSFLILIFFSSSFLILSVIISTKKALQ
jgi:hypothetical protein